jgi:hypothetical protein
MPVAADLRYALRALRRNPAFAAAAIAVRHVCSRNLPSIFQPLYPPFFRVFEPATVSSWGYSQLPGSLQVVKVFLS